MRASCLHPGRPASARCDGCPFTDHGAPTAGLAAQLRELEPSLDERAGALHPCDSGCLFEVQTLAAS